MGVVFPIFNVKKQGLDTAFKFAIIIIVETTALSVYRDGSFYL